METGDWYLEVNGKKVGPFTFDQIEGFFNDGEIRAYHQVTSDQLQGRWMSVEELLQSRAPLAGSPPPPPPPPPEDSSETLVAIHTQPSGSFQPPPRPEIEAHPPVETRPDPAESIFTALQVVRERRNAILPPSVKAARQRGVFLKIPIDFSELKNASESLKKLIPKDLTQRLILTAVFTGIVLGSITWAIVKTVRSKAAPASGRMTVIDRHHEYPKAIPRIPEPMRPTVRIPPQRIIPQPPPAAIHVAPIARPNLQNAGPPPREQYAPENGNEYPPRDENENPQQQQNPENAQKNPEQDQPQYEDQQQGNPEQQGQPDQQPGGGQMNPNSGPNSGNENAPGQDEFKQQDQQLQQFQQQPTQ